MEGTSSEMVRFVFRPKTKCNKRFARQHRYEPPQESLLTSPFSRCVHHLSSPDTCLCQTTLSRNVHQKHIHLQKHTQKYIEEQKCYHESSRRTQPQLEWECDVSVLCMFFVCMSDQHTCENKPQHMHMYSHIVCDRIPKFELFFL